ncbi:outer membrane efflux protein [Chitinophaga dinghuensis]|uniref:Outer membrane efflux protein n=1 Tax=Chitinophaga dinghuensis TaxID=1539050 RepID=A0A327VVC1_9BACT|nr:TolC family protein [Chitinophaga dinghuensis]RAJ79951.1 outer membrane efflux protein [Chitinophaga dinghuensis]
MKKLLLFALSLCFVLHVQAQKDTLGLNYILKSPLLEARFKQLIVDLASKTPIQDAVQTKEKISDYQIANARAQWLSHVTFFTNLNENSFNRNSTYYNPNNPNDPKNDNNKNNYYPTYNLGLAFSLGDFFTTPRSVKIAQAQKKLFDAERQADLRSSKNKVLIEYENFIATKKLFELHLPLLEEALNNFQSTEKKFAAGEVAIEVYSAAYKAYNVEMVQNVKLVRDMNQAKIDLETSINMPLENAIQLMNK